MDPSTSIIYRELVFSLMQIYNGTKTVGFFPMGIGFIPFPFLSAFIATPSHSQVGVLFPFPWDSHGILIPIGNPFPMVISNHQVCIDEDTQVTNGLNLVSLIGVPLSSSGDLNWQLIPLTSCRRTVMRSFLFVSMVFSHIHTLIII